MGTSAAKILLAGLILCAASGCAAIHNKAGNAPWSPGIALDMGAPANVMGENAIVLMFSGGGLRAAAFAQGVLEGLREVRTPQGDLLEDVSIISSVSGSSLTSAYYGLYGRNGLARFREEVLLPGFEGGLRLSLFNPANLSRVMQGGLNTREDFGDVLDRKVFHGATFGDIYRRGVPSIRIHATDLYHRVPFPFFPPVFAVLCSDLSKYPVADAVAASMAVPMVFAPTVIRTFPDNCPPLPPEVEGLKLAARSSHSLDAIARAVQTYRDGKVRYIKLADGGLTDNYGGVSLFTNSRLIYGTPYAPMSAGDAVRIRRLLVIVADASRGPNGDWIDHDAGPVGMELALSGMDAAVDTTARFAADAFEAMISDWQRAVIAFRCKLTREEVWRLGGPADWDCSDVRFTLARLSTASLASPARERIDAIPTRLTLTPLEIDTTIDGARAGTLSLPELETYRRSRTGR